MDSTQFGFAAGVKEGAEPGVGAKIRLSLRSTTVFSCALQATQYDSKIGRSGAWLHCFVHTQTRELNISTSNKQDKGPDMGLDMPTTADEAKSFYNAELKESLERDFSGQYVAIVSESRRHFIRPTFVEAAQAAREAEPSQIPFVIRIGHDAAFHIGAAST